MEAARMPPLQTFSFIPFGHEIRLHKLFEIGFCPFLAILKAFFVPKTKIRPFWLFEKGFKKNLAWAMSRCAGKYIVWCL